MNGYTAQALADVARRGKHVVVISHTAHASRHAANEFHPHSRDASRVSKANGKLRIEYPSGGCIRFASMRSEDTSAMTAAVMFLDWDVEITDPLYVEQLSIAQAMDTEIVRA